MEWDNHGKVRREAAHAPDDEVLLPPLGDRLQLATRVPHTAETAWEALHYALYWAQGALGGPLSPGTHPRVDTPSHPLRGPDAPPRGRHRAPAPHLAHEPARQPAGG